MTWYQKIRNSRIAMAIVVLAPLFAGITAAWNMVKVWDEWGLPRPIFLSEINRHALDQDKKFATLRSRIDNLEEEYRDRSIRVDQRSLREIEHEIDSMVKEGKTIPDYVLDLRQSLLDNIAYNKSRLAELRKD
jgi:hypothetical protein